VPARGGGGGRRPPARGGPGVRPGDPPLGRLVEKEATELVKLLCDFPALVARAAVAREPHRLTTYCEDVARAFHRFYHEHRILQDDRDLALARLALCHATRRVLAHALELMSITAPDSMSRQT